MYSARIGPLLVLEHHAGGTLHDYMRTNGAGLSTSDKLLIMSDILSALVHLHEHHHTAWGDLHPTNIVLDHNGSPKLCGLGPRASLHHEAASQNDLAVLRYFAPERFQPEATMSHAATDIWAFGCLALMVRYDSFAPVTSLL
ncbi:kinase-like protein [Ceratobasidium sp. AG-I]|nr:kinase-like protein [Ceratobasidium sp. AG-I]